jgi:putative FmdB family regulatory protein
MATYDLRCVSCGREFDVFVQGFLKDDSKVCPDCGSAKVEQRFTGFLRGASDSSSAAPSLGGGCSSHGFG